jgi:hypothetical protein
LSCVGENMHCKPNTVARELFLRCWSTMLRENCLSFMSSWSKGNESSFANVVSLLMIKAQDLKEMENSLALRADESSETRTCEIGGEHSFTAGTSIYPYFTWGQEIAN